MELDKQWVGGGGGREDVSTEFRWVILFINIIKNLQNTIDITKDVFWGAPETDGYCYELSGDVKLRVLPSKFATRFTKLI
jgi:hypothetical protein